jgi:mannose-6-phosphate isomerase-like protein (cupin superfamily)
MVDNPHLPPGYAERLRELNNSLVPVAEFPIPEVLERQWGEEIVGVVASGKYSMKEIHVRKGERGGLQRHHLKDEAGFIVYGRMLVRYDDGTGQLVERIIGPKDFFHFPAGCVHQTEALTAVCYVEASTPHFNDRVHVEHEYGIEKEDGGLPSTSLEDVETR